MGETPRTDAVRTDAISGYSKHELQTGALFLIAEMLERIAIALEDDE